MDKHCTSHLDLLLAEVVNNVLEHGSDSVCDTFINVSTWIHDDKIILVIRDNGRQTPDQSVYKNATLPNATDLPENGWGLGLINLLADDINLSRNQNINTIQITKLRNQTVSGPSTCQSTYQAF
ncbi:hypothetical protein AB833_00420 [Chromatiales bacterium (ex Bugula neritina AB1)]|nr:hypothetical protein AB833_00420 [Chromatiales bacterium (ex Bugula neritina AB1)]